MLQAFPDGTLSNAANSLWDTCTCSVRHSRSPVACTRCQVMPAEGLAASALSISHQLHTSCSLLANVAAGDLHRKLWGELLLLPCLALPTRVPLPYPVTMVTLNDSSFVNHPTNIHACDAGLLP